MLTVFGSVVLDTIHTPTHTFRDAPGGSAVYASLASSLFAPTRLVAIAGEDFPESHAKLLARRMDTGGLQIRAGKTFRYEARYENHFEDRVDIRVEPNVSLEGGPSLPEGYERSGFVYLANDNPGQQIKVLEMLGSPGFVMCDTIGHWITTMRDEVVKVVSMVDAVIINEGEARALTGKHNLTECAGVISGWGPDYTIIKKAEHGSLLFCGDAAYPLPGFPVRRLLDPTGAGDSFAGAVMGYLDSAGRVDAESMRRACMYGNVLGSLAVEEYGIDGLVGLDRAGVESRARKYRSITCLEGE